VWEGVGGWGGRGGREGDGRGGRKKQGMESEGRGRKQWGRRRFKKYIVHLWTALSTCDIYICSPYLCSSTMLGWLEEGDTIRGCYRANFTGRMILNGQFHNSYTTSGL